MGSCLVIRLSAPPLFSPAALSPLQSRQWETSMMPSPCEQPKGCCAACFCPPCMACYLRGRALQYDWTKYKCCQGYICWRCVSCCPTESCPQCCLCLEVWLCESCAISATRIYVQEERQIQTDPCDNRIIRFNNCMQILSCICHIMAMISDMFEAAAAIIDLIADITYCITQACMQAQTCHEPELHKTPEAY